MSDELQAAAARCWQQYDRMAVRLDHLLDGHPGISQVGDAVAVLRQVRKLLEDQVSDLLKITLSMAVPLWIEEVRTWSVERRLERAKVCGQVVAEKGDIIQFKSKKKGETAEAFNKLAEGLAIMAFQPGGVTFMDMHFEANNGPT